MKNLKKIFFVSILAIGLMLAIQGESEAVQLHYFDINVVGEWTDLGGGLHLYEYTLSDAGGEGNLKDVSHWWIELPKYKIPTLSDYTPSNFTVENYNFNEPVGPYAGKHDGVKWEVKEGEDGLITYSFTSTHGPVLGSDGRPDPSAYLWFAKSGNSGDYIDEGRTLGPNGTHETIPEPTSITLLGIGLIGLVKNKRKFFG